MTGLDTNVIVRYITQDDRTQAASANRIIHSFSEDDRGFVTLIVMVEVVWVLEAAYRLKKEEVIRVLEMLLTSRELLIERADVAWQALRRFTSGNADFADCLIECCGKAAGCIHTYTFDQNAAKSAGMRLVK